MLAGGKRVAELEERWADVHRRQARDRRQQRDRRADVHLRRASASGRATRSSPSATRSTRRSARSCSPARRRSSSTSSPTPTSSTPTGSRRRSRRGRGRSARSTCSACRPTWTMIPAIADRHGLAVVEDACQAHGAEFRGRRVGSFGHGAFSLYGTKNMTTGEGGLITTDDDRLADWIRLYRNQGMRERYHHEILGYNFRLTDIAAAIGLVPARQAASATRPAARRSRPRYDAAFADLPIRTPVTPAGRTHVFHQYTIDVGDDRDAIVADLAAAGVGDRDLLPDPGPPPAVRPGARAPRRPAGDRRGRRPDAVAADVPRPDRRRAGRRSSPRSGPPSSADAGVRTPRRAARGAPPDDRRLGAGRRPRAAGRPGRPRLDGPQPPARPARRWPASGSSRSPTRIAAALDAATADDRRARASRSRWRCSPRRTSTRSSSPPRRRATSPLALAAIERGHRGPRREAARRHADEAMRIVAAAPRRGASPVQVGHIERFNPAVLELGRLLEAGWLSTRLRDREPPRRPVPGPDPRRRRDRRPRDPRRRHPVAGSPASGRSRVYAETAQRIHADHEDLLFGLLSVPVGHGRACSTSTG